MQLKFKFPDPQCQPRLGFVVTYSVSYYQYSSLNRIKTVI